MSISFENQLYNSSSKDAVNITPEIQDNISLFADDGILLHHLLLPHLSQGLRQQQYERKQTQHGDSLPGQLMECPNPSLLAPL